MVLTLTLEYASFLKQIEMVLTTFKMTLRHFSLDYSEWKRILSMQNCAGKNQC